MLPVSIFLFDLFLIQGVTIENIKKNWAVCLFALILVPAIGFMYYDFSSIIGNYDIARPFTMMGEGTDPAAGDPFLYFSFAYTPSHPA